MPPERTDHSKYLSKYAPPGEQLFIRGDQYLAELMCERQALRDKVYLKPKFWNEPAWTKEFRLQLKHAKYYLNLYSITAVLAALKHRKAAKLFSLGLKSVLEPLVVSEQARLDVTPTKVVTESIDVTERPRPTFQGNTLKSKLKDM